MEETGTGIPLAYLFLKLPPKVPGPEAGWPAPLPNPKEVMQPVMELVGVAAFIVAGPLIQLVIKAVMGPKVQQVLRHQVEEVLPVQVLLQKFRRNLLQIPMLVR